MLFLWHVFCFIELNDILIIMERRNTPEINAGSMADIAFLLLIFFLVTTTMEVDAGISRRLPEKQPPTNIFIKERNVFEVIINKNNELLVEGEYVEIENLEKLAIQFIDNGEGVGNPILLFGEIVGEECGWCMGEKKESSSVHPNKAVISLKTDRSTSFGTFIEVQNEINAAYTFLRNRLSKQLYEVSYTELVNSLEKDKKNKSLASKVKKIRAMYPEIISESENN